MHVVTTRRQYTDRSGVTKTYRAHLLRRSFREGGKVKNETLGNLSALPDAAVDAVKAVLRGQVLIPAGVPARRWRSWPRCRTGMSPPWSGPPAGWVPELFPRSPLGCSRP